MLITSCVMCVASVERRQEMLMEAFAPRKTKGFSTTQSPLALFVKKLQESLTRMESFDVVTVSQGIDGPQTIFLLLTLN